MKLAMFVKDAQGSVRGEQYDAGSVSRFEYSAYGSALERAVPEKRNGGWAFSITVKVKSGIGYTGHYGDNESGLYYARARYYDPAEGRFITPDPVDDARRYSAPGLNVYVYGMNNPVMYWDPDGQFVWAAVEAAVGFVVGGVNTAIRYWDAYQKGDMELWEYALNIGLGGACGAFTMAMNTNGIPLNFNISTRDWSVGVGYSFAGLVKGGAEIHGKWDGSTWGYSVSAGVGDVFGVSASFGQDYDARTGEWTTTVGAGIFVSGKMGGGYSLGGNLGINVKFDEDWRVSGFGVNGGVNVGVTEDGQTWTGGLDGGANWKRVRGEFQYDGMWVSESLGYTREREGEVFGNKYSYSSGGTQTARWEKNRYRQVKFSGSYSGSVTYNGMVNGGGMNPEYAGWGAIQRPEDIAYYASLAGPKQAPSWEVIAHGAYDEKWVVEQNAKWAAAQKRKQDIQATDYWYYRICNSVADTDAEKKIWNALYIQVQNGNIEAIKNGLPGLRKYYQANQDAPKVPHEATLFAQGFEASDGTETGKPGIFSGLVTESMFSVFGPDYYTTDYKNHFWSSLGKDIGYGVVGFGKNMVNIATTTIGTPLYIAGNIVPEETQRDLLSLSMSMGPMPSVDDLITSGMIEARSLSGQAMAFAASLRKMTTSGKVARGGGELVVYDAKFAVRQLLQDGNISVDDLRLMVRDGVPNEFIGNPRITAGFKYTYDINGTRVQIKWHSVDQKWIGTSANSGNGWTAQFEIGSGNNRVFLGQDGNFYSRPDNITHIPVTGN